MVSPGGWGNWFDEANHRDAAGVSESRSAPKMPSALFDRAVVAGREGCGKAAVEANATVVTPAATGGVASLESDSDSQDDRAFDAD